ncbi:MAG: Ldh family oxidoreductase [Chloroflexota bacterium]
MSTTPLTVTEIYDLANQCLLHNGCDEANANAVATTISTAERDGSESHGLFRLPGYIASLRSGKVNGRSNPTPNFVTPVAIRLDGDHGFAPYAIEVGIPHLAGAAHKFGVAVLAIVKTHHFAALWPETEALAERGLVGMACTAAVPMVAPFGAKRPLFSTNPISFAWPRPGQTPYVFDMATAAKARGDIGIAARDGHELPLGVGLDADGNPTTDAAKIHNGGVILPFGGYKGSALATMIELLSAGLMGERFSYEAGEADNGDGGPSTGGEFIMAMSPELLAGPNWQEHSEAFLNRLGGMEGVRLPGQRRHANRLSNAPRNINADLVQKIRTLST